MNKERLKYPIITDLDGNGKRLDELKYPIIIDETGCSLVYEHDKDEWDGDEKQLVIDHIARELREQLDPSWYWATDCLDEKVLNYDRGAYLGVYTSADEVLKNLAEEFDEEDYYEKTKM